MGLESHNNFKNNNAPLPKLTIVQLTNHITRNLQIETYKFVHTHISNLQNIAYTYKTGCGGCISNIVGS